VERHDLALRESPIFRHGKLALHVLESGQETEPPAESRIFVDVHVPGAPQVREAAEADERAIPFDYELADFFEAFEAFRIVEAIVADLEVLESFESFESREASEAHVVDHAELARRSERFQARQ
jgi:hypothetical protein